MSDVELNPPKRRTCTRCGREDVWDEEVTDWTIKEVDGTKQSGDRFCMHEWDITGSHAPITERQCASTYRWDGRVHEEPETVLLAKTDSGNVADLVELIEAEHPHDTPCIERFDEDVLVEAYEECREEVTL